MGLDSVRVIWRRGYSASSSDRRSHSRVHRPMCANQDILPIVRPVTKSIHVASTISNPSSLTLTLTTCFACTRHPRVAVTVAALTVFAPSVAAEQPVLASFQFLTEKSVVYVCNMDDR